MNHTEYHIEMKHQGVWYGLDVSRDPMKIRDDLRGLRKEHPDREYQLVKLEMKREVIG